MKRKYLLFVPLLWGVLWTGCQRDDMDAIGDNPDNNSKSVVVLTIEPGGSVVSLTIDALPENRTGVWIDLDGDGVRASDASEDVTVFDKSCEYRLAPGVNTVKVHGDVTRVGAESVGCTHIDISGNPHLKTLHVPFNTLRSLNLSGNSALESLDVSNNGLEALDLSANPHLRTLWCFNNRLSELDLSKNTDLTGLDCSGNVLTTLDLSRNGQLISVVAYNNRLTKFVPSSGDVLTQLWLFGNSFTSGDLVKMVGNLGKSKEGDLWLSEEAMSETLKEQATRKGWVVGDVVL